MGVSSYVPPRVRGPAPCANAQTYLGARSSLRQHDGGWGDPHTEKLRPLILWRLIRLSRRALGLLGPVADHQLDWGRVAHETSLPFKRPRRRRPRRPREGCDGTSGRAFGRRPVLLTAHRDALGGRRSTRGWERPSSPPTWLPRTASSAVCRVYFASLRPVSSIATGVSVRLCASTPTTTMVYDLLDRFNGVALGRPGTRLY